MDAGNVNAKRAVVIIRQLAVAAQTFMADADVMRMGELNHGLPMLFSARDAIDKWLITSIRWSRRIASGPPSAEGAN